MKSYDEWGGEVDMRGGVEWERLLEHYRGVLELVVSH